MLAVTAWLELRSTEAAASRPIHMHKNCWYTSCCYQCWVLAWTAAVTTQTLQRLQLLGVLRTCNR
jgi:hypothetical protein